MLSRRSTQQVAQTLLMCRLEYNLRYALIYHGLQLTVQVWHTGKLL